ncbi:MAG: type I 3-dehydroquinate dehydratase [Prevotellaceae bacterium]|jgi:3-dehydroquinate dehydratase-1|nr:type I 3-dehydroquinate dehydratase [Prevotellaceae bacterium]
MQDNTVCVSIGEKTFATIDSVLKQVDFAEIRLDLSSIDGEEIRRLFSCGKPLIATCREGAYGKNQRLERLTAAICAGAAFVDVETEADDDFRATVVALAKQHGCRVIISFHDFEGTPSVAKLEATVEQCRAQGADIVKLVTTACTTADSSKVLSLYSRFPNLSLIAFAMGCKGLITRVACLYLGAPYTYVAISDDRTVASGQISLVRMKNIMDNLNNNCVI